MKKRPAVLAGVVLAALALSGCTSAGPKAASADKTLVIAINTAPISLDPSKSAIGFAVNYEEPAYASLLNHDVNGNIVAGLADKWGYVGSGNTDFQLTLRPGVKWADGTAITAQQVVASIQYFAKGSGPNASYFAPLTVTAQGDSTVDIKSPTPNPVLATLLTPDYLGGAIVSPAGLKNPAGLADATFGAGQYVYNAKKSVSGSAYVYTPNKYFYDKAAVKYDSITIKVIPNMNSAVQALKAGQIDAMQANADAVAAVKGDASIKQISAPLTWTGLYLLDRAGTIVPALKDVRVRQALNYAVDRSAIAKALYGSFGQPVDQPAVPGFDGYDPSLAGAYPYDPAKAKSLLSAAGYAKGLTIPVNYGSFDADSAKLVQAVQSEFAQVGVTLKLTGAPNFGGWVNNLVSKKFAATALPGGAGGSAYFLDQSTFLPKGIMNVFGVSNSEISDSFAAFTAAPDAERTTAAHKVTQIAVDQALSLPVAAADGILLFNSKVQGLQFTKTTANPTYVTQWVSK